MTCTASASRSVTASSTAPIRWPAPGSAPATTSDNLGAAVGHAPDPHARGSRHHRRQPSGRGGGHRHRARLHHPDLAPNYSAAHSTDCSSGVPQPLLPGNDVDGHGTHTAGTIAAASNGTGIVGVAPRVKIAGIKSSNNDGFFFPEMVICSFMWAATHGIHVTNNSYFADPWLFNCANDPEQRVIWEAERRAIRFAQSNGTVVVASEGNESTDLAPARRPDQPGLPAWQRPVPRDHERVQVVPVEVPGVVGVTATGNRELKSFYSSYGVSTADVAAPGGDSILQVTPAAPNGAGPVDVSRRRACVRQVFDPDDGGEVLLPAGDVDGRTARDRRRRADHQPDRQERRGGRRLRSNRRRTPSRAATRRSTRHSRRTAAAADAPAASARTALRGGREIDALRAVS